jgi:transposase
MSRADWSPSKKVIQQAIKHLVGKQSAWVKRRIAILNSLSSHGRKTPLRKVARAAGTRTVTLQRLLDRWRAGGTEPLVRFGRPLDLDSIRLQRLKQEIGRGHLKSRAEVMGWIKNEFNIPLSPASVRAYCRRLRFRLPSRIKPPPLKHLARIRRIWTDRQIANLKSVEKKLGLRALTVLEVGTTDKSINKIADEHRIPRSNLQRDVRRFVREGIKGLTKHGPRLNAFKRKKAWDTFLRWCDEKYILTGKPPRALETLKFLKTLRIKISRRTVYTHLRNWKGLRGIEPVKKRRPKKIIPSEGLAVRSLFP